MSHRHMTVDERMEDLVYLNRGNTECHSVCLVASRRDARERSGKGVTNPCQNGRKLC
ncbi:hypothetical protein E2C01_061713 [Portunus trituberculatus]|uniref:Uncharacterized protein n=1 Tax=Portunus trituberculatus TaxID=210409 RepID=A0A5B7HBZ3_PORTR|nr:hypothetical protein [Portunus trituberculatus]